MNDEHISLLTSVFNPPSNEGGDLVWRKKFPDNDSIYFELRLSPNGAICLKCRGVVAPIGSEYFRYSDSFIDDLCISLIRISSGFRDYSEQLKKFIDLGLIPMSRKERLEHLLETSRNDQLPTDTFDKFTLWLIRGISRNQ